MMVTRGFDSPLWGNLRIAGQQIKLINMCILIIKPAGVDMPSKKTFQNCFDNNPDGAGFAYSDGRKLYLKKGYMSFEPFWKDLVAVSKATKNLVDYPVMLHFRIATHGTVKAENTHPFNVGDNMVAGHNGILNIKPQGDLTDSETFFKNVCAPMLERFPLDSPQFSRVVLSLIDSSKVAFLSDTGEIKMFGQFLLKDGVYYSNSTYTYSYYSAYDYKPYKNNAIVPKHYGLDNEYDSYDEWYDDNYGSKMQSGSPFTKTAEEFYDQGRDKQVESIAGVEIGSEDHWSLIFDYDDLVSGKRMNPQAALARMVKDYKISKDDILKLVEAGSSLGE